jgi:TFIIF-interacting CTD phosphatase-like protein
MQDNEEEENANNDITASSSSIAEAALAAARRSSTNSSSSVTTVVDVDGDVTMAENNYKLHYRYTEEEEEEVVTTTTTTRYHDEESPPTPDKYTISSSRTNEEDANNAEDDDDDDDEFNPYLFIKCLPPYHYATPPGWISRPKALPPPNYTSHPPTPPICLVLDLDETLVHCTVEAVQDADMVFPVEFHGVEYLVHVRCRPYLREFLEMVHEKFEVVIFTASQQVYADKLLDKIDPGELFVRLRVCMESLEALLAFVRSLSSHATPLSQTYPLPIER